MNFIISYIIQEFVGLDLKYEICIYRGWNYWKYKT